MLTPSPPNWPDGNDGLAVPDISVAFPAGSGNHTNWMFSQGVNIGNPIDDGRYIGTIAAHETGHTFNMQHQSDYIGSTLVNENGVGDDFSGPGSYVPIMGNADNRQRIAWRAGPTRNNNVPTFQNNVAVIANSAGMSIVDSGIGHSFATATPLPMTPAGNVNVTHPNHRGIISPVNSGSGFNPIGVSNYTTDFFSFTSDGVNSITLTLNDGNDLIMPGVADPGATLRSSLSIHNASFTLIGSGIEDASTLVRTYSSLLSAGTYYAEIRSFGGHQEVNPGYIAAAYYDMGGYFLTGSGFARRCVADVDDGSGTGTPDGGVTIDDLLYYLQIFQDGVIAADVDDGSFTGTRDGGVTIDDLLYFLARFEAGC